MTSALALLLRAVFSLALITAAVRRGGPGRRRLALAGVLLSFASMGAGLALVVAAHSPGITAQEDLAAFSALGSTAADLLASILLLSGLAATTRVLRAQAPS